MRGELGSGLVISVLYFGLHVGAFFAWRHMKILMVVLGFAVSLSAADLSGKWTGTFEAHDGEVKPALLMLQQTGEALTGTVGPNADHQRPIRNGKVAGNKVTFEFETDAVMKCALTLDEDRLHGDITAQAHGRTLLSKLDVTRKNE
jgi:hypothetical protein